MTYKTPDIVERLRQAGDHYGIPMERDCAEASELIVRLREALSSIKIEASRVRGDQAYRDFARFARRTAEKALNKPMVVVSTTDTDQDGNHIEAEIPAWWLESTKL